MINIFRKEIDIERYFIVTYIISSETNLKDAAWNLAIGQSVGNPNIRNHWETDELFENHSCMILHEENELSDISEGIVNIAFPIININFKTDGISHLLVNIMGGQLDIDIIKKLNQEGIFGKDRYVICNGFKPKAYISNIADLINQAGAEEQHLSR